MCLQSARSGSTKTLSKDFTQRASEALPEGLLDGLRTPSRKAAESLRTTPNPLSKGFQNGFRNPSRRASEGFQEGRSKALYNDLQKGSSNVSDDKSIKHTRDRQHIGCTCRKEVGKQRKGGA